MIRPTCQLFLPGIRIKNATCTVWGTIIWSSPSSDRLLYLAGVIIRVYESFWSTMGPDHITARRTRTSINDSQRSKRPNVGSISGRRRSGAPSRKGRVVNGQLLRHATNECALPRSSPLCLTATRRPPLLSIPRTLGGTITYPIANSCNLSGTRSARELLPDLAAHGARGQSQAQLIPM